MGNPCDSVDMDLFYAATTITIGKGKTASFWDSPWLNGKSLKDIAPLIFDASTRKNWKVKQALHNNSWISKIKMDASLTIPHIDRKSTRLNSSHSGESRMPSSA